MRVLIQLRYSLPTHEASRNRMPAPGLGVHLESTISGLSIDPDYPPIQLPGVRPATGGHLFSAAPPMQFSMGPAQSTYIVRGQIPDGGPQAGARRPAGGAPGRPGGLQAPPGRAGPAGWGRAPPPPR